MLRQQSQLPLQRNLLTYLVEKKTLGQYAHTGLWLTNCRRNKVRNGASNNLRILGMNPRDGIFRYGWYGYVMGKF